MKEILVLSVTIIALIIAILILVMLTFFIARFCIMLWTGCTKNEAEKKIHRAMRSPARIYHVATDPFLIENLWEAIHVVIGDARFDQLVKISQVTPIISSGSASGLPYIVLASPSSNVNEQMQIDALLREIMESNLSIRGLNQRVLIDHKFNPDLQMDMVMIRCAETPEEMELLENTHKHNATQIIHQQAPVLDEDLNDE